MAERTYKKVDTPPGQRGHHIHEFVDGADAGPFLWLPAGTATEAVFETITALQRAYQQGRDDRLTSPWRSHQGGGDG